MRQNLFKSDMVAGHVSCRPGVLSWQRCLLNSILVDELGLKWSSMMEISVALSTYVCQRHRDQDDGPVCEEDVHDLLPALCSPSSMAILADMRGIDRTVQRVPRPSNALQWLHTVRLGTLPEGDFVRLVALPIQRFVQFSDKCEAIFGEEERARNADPNRKAEHLNCRTPVPAKVPCTVQRSCRHCYCLAAKFVCGSVQHKFSHLAPCSVNGAASIAHHADLSLPVVSLGGKRASALSSRLLLVPMNK